MPIQTGGQAPYGPPAAVITIIDGYRDRGYAPPFTNEMLTRAGVTDSLAPRTLQALKLLELVTEDGHPTETFEALRTVRGEDEYRKALSEWLQGVYAEVLRFADPVKDPPERVREAFRGCQPAGQLDRMVTLMLGLYAHAGLIDQPVPSPATAQRRPKSPARKQVVRTPVTRKERPLDRVDPAGEGELHPALVGLLRQIPRDGHGWTEARRDQFLEAFRAVLDFSVPARQREPSVLDSLTGAFAQEEEGGEADAASAVDD